MHTPLQRALLNEYQRGFPLVPEPFAAIAKERQVGEEEVRAAFHELQASGAISRIGPVFAPGRFGASTLAALAVPAERLAEIAELVNAYPEVNHNYEREHHFNLWFVVNAATAARRQAVLDEIRAASGMPLLDLPMIEGFHIDLGFDLDGAEARPVVADGEARAPTALSVDEERLLAATQSGIALVARPFAEIGARAGLPEEAVLRGLDAWLRQGLIKRFGVVVRHRELGFAANAMVVWVIPEAEVCAAGEALAALPWVTLCYRRPARPPQWPYTLFCMIHGRDRATVLRQVDEAARRAGLESVERAVLFSSKRFKQRGARYRNAEPAHG